jgi:hypothetical protein
MSDEGILFKSDDECPADDEWPAENLLYPSWEADRKQSLSELGDVLQSEKYDRVTRAVECWRGMKNVSTPFGVYHVIEAVLTEGRRDHLTKFRFIGKVTLAKLEECLLAEGIQLDDERPPELSTRTWTLLWNNNVGRTRAEVKAAIESGRLRPGKNRMYGPVAHSQLCEYAGLPNPIAVKRKAIVDKRKASLALLKEEVKRLEELADKRACRILSLEIEIKRRQPEVTT